MNLSIKEREMESNKQDSLLKKKIQIGINSEIENLRCKGSFYQSIGSNTELIELKNLSLSDGICKVRNNLRLINKKIVEQTDDGSVKVKDDRSAKTDKIIINLMIAKGSITYLKNKTNKQIKLEDQQNFQSLLDEFKKLVTKFEDVLISQNQKLFFEGFATRLDGYINVAKLQKAVENCGSIYAMITFAKNVQNVDYESMLQALYQNFDPDEIKDKLKSSQSEGVDMLKHQLHDYYFLENYLNDQISKSKDSMKN